MSLLIGNAPNQVPTNGMLGRVAYLDTYFPVVILLSANYTVTLDDAGKVFICSGTITVTLPPAASAFNLNGGFMVGIKAKTGAVVTVARTGSDTIDTVAGNKSMTANSALMFVADSVTSYESI